MTRETPTAENLETKARALLTPCGLVSFGWFHAEDERPGLLIGNAGSSLWPAFSAWDATHPGPDPLNRWTVSAIEPVSRSLNAEARYPFGDTIWPFQRYAAEAAGLRPSPLGLLIHPRYGLWIAFRAALIFDRILELPQIEFGPHPCDLCADKPCLSACPVNAFDRDGYDVGRCRGHLAATEGSDCMNHGCRARLACPVGTAYAYDDAQQRFHMSAFRGAMETLGGR